MKRTVALILSILFLLTFSGCFGKPAPSPTPAPASAAPVPSPDRGETIITAPPTAEPTAEPAPVQTPEPTAVPIPEATPQPVQPTAAPAPAPSQAGKLIASGSFRSDTGTYLNLIADWKEETINDNSFKLTVVLSLESYSLDVGERRSNTLTFNGKEYSFITDPIEIEEGFTKTQIYVWSQELPLSELEFDLNVSWNFRGSYSGKELETVELSGSYRNHG